MTHLKLTISPSEVLTKDRLLLHVASECGKPNGVLDVDDLSERFPPLPRIGLMGYGDAPVAHLLQVINRYASLLKMHRPGLSFGRLEALVVTTCFRDALAYYSRDSGLSLAALTQLAQGEDTLATVMTTSVGVVVVIRDEAVRLLYSPLESDSVRGVRILWHELCHVHDLGLRHSWHREGRGGMYGHCSVMWAEYFANRLSYFEGAGFADDWTRLEVSLDYTEKVGPALALRQWLMIAGYVLGSLAGAGQDLQELRPDLYRRLHACGLLPAWIEAGRVADELAVSGACWRNADGVLGLAPAVRSIEDACRSN